MSSERNKRGIAKTKPYRQAIGGARNIAWSLTNAHVHPEVLDRLPELGKQLGELLDAGQAEVWTLAQEVMRLEDQEA